MPKTGKRPYNTQWKMAPFLALNLSPATYLPRWPLLEETHQFGLEGGVRRGTFAVAVAYGGMYLRENATAPEEALTTSYYYRLYNLTLYRDVGDLSPFLSLSLAKPVIMGVRDGEIDGFNSSLRGVSLGLRAGVSYVWRYRILSIAPTVGLAYYPSLTIYREVDGVVRPKGEVRVLRATAHVSLALGR